MSGVLRRDAGEGSGDKNRFQPRRGGGALRRRPSPLRGLNAFFQFSPQVETWG